MLTKAFHYLLIDYGADQILDGTECQVVRLQGHHLPGKSDLKEEGDPVKGACGTRNAVIPIGEADAERHRRTG